MFMRKVRAPRGNACPVPARKRSCLLRYSCPLRACCGALSACVQVQPITARIPQMTTAGNHELWANFSECGVVGARGRGTPATCASGHEELLLLLRAATASASAAAYKARFSMPNEDATQSMYYDFAAGGVTFIMFNTETAIGEQHAVADQCRASPRL